MKKKLIFLFFLSIIIKSQTQTGTPVYIQKSLPNVSKPELTNILRFDQFPDIGFIGGTDISIPIYTIKMGDLEIPISLSYNTKGFKLNDISPNTGLGWSLIADGTVTLKVNDLNDFNESTLIMSTDFSDFEPAPPTECRISRGFLMPEYWVGGAASYPFDFKIDSSPDVYSINAPGLKNKFYLEKGSNGYNPKFLNYSLTKAEPLYLEAADTHYPVPAAWNVEFKKMFFYNEKGYKYGFGSPSGSHMSRTVRDGVGEIGDRASLSDLTAPFYDTWQLDYIQSPNGDDRVEYTYENYANTYSHPTLKTAQMLYIPGYDFNVNSIIQEGVNPLIFPSNVNPALVNYYVYTNLISVKRLKNIKYKDLSINFNYNNNRQDYPGQSLDKIEIKYKNVTIKEFLLSYSYFLPKDSSCNDSYDCLRLRLDKVYEQGVGDYTFNYGNNNSDYLLPKRSSSKVDFLGYYNNNTSDIKTSPSEIESVKYNGGIFPTSKIYFYPSLERDNFLPFELSGSTNQQFYTLGSIDRKPNISSLTGLLSKIIYPTGGFMEMEYENDDFDYLGSTYILGTARIKKIRKRENDVTLKEMSFSYKEGNKSTGQINYFIPPAATIPPKSGFTSDIPLGAVTNMEKFLNEDVSVTLGYNQDTYVGYSKVAETQTGKGKTIYSYDNFNDYPDVLPTKNDLGCLSEDEKKFLKYFKYPYKNVEEYKEFRGRIKKKQYFSEVDLINPIKEEILNYEEKSDTNINLTNTIFKITAIRTDARGYNDTGCGFLANSKINIKQSYLSNVETRDYNGTQYLSHITSYDYDKSRNLLKKQTSSFSDNVVEESYKYAYDFGNNGDLIAWNMVGIPLEITKYNNNIPLSKVKSNYSRDWIGHEKLLPLSIQSVENIENIDTPNEIFENDVIYGQYDTKGNLLEYKEKNGQTTTIIYGYDQTLPIAKIEGIGYTDFMNVMGLSSNLTGYNSLDICQKSNVDANKTPGSDESELITSLDAFRKSNQLLGYQITTYTYDPLIGVRSITSPNGIRENYYYDSANRLEKIVDLDGKIVKEYKYNYAPKYYNTEKSKTFIKNNCSSGQSSSGTYAYTVPFGKHISTVSQSEADQMAETDLNNNGQALANSSGSCSYIGCNVSAFQNESFQYQYSNFEFESANTIKAYLQVKFNSSPVINWQQNPLFIIGTICQDLKPSADRYIIPAETNSWQMIVTSQGQVQMKWNGPGSPSTTNNIGLNFKYNK